MTPEAKKQTIMERTRANFPYLIHLYNEDYGDFYYANTDRDIEYDGHTYVSCLFSVLPPQKTNTSISNTKLTLSAIDQTWIVKIRNTQKRSKVDFVALIGYYGNEGQYEIEPLSDSTFTLTDVSWDDVSITWTMIFDDRMDIRVPCDIGGSQNCPGCA